jgi:hypothetical protein
MRFYSILILLILSSMTNIYSQTSSAKMICKNEAVPNGYVISGETISPECSGRAWIIRKRGQQATIDPNRLPTIAPSENGNKIISKDKGLRPDWVRYSTASGKYSISLPGAPHERTIDVPCRNQQVTLYTIMWTDNEVAYTALYGDLPVSIDDTNLVRLGFDLGRNKLLSKPGTHLISEKDFFYQKKYPARELTFQTMEGTIKLYAIVVRDRLYEVLIMSRTDSSKLDDADAKEVWKSFKIGPQGS